MVHCCSPHSNWLPVWTSLAATLFRELTGLIHVANPTLMPGTNRPGTLSMDTATTLQITMTSIVCVVLSKQSPWQPSAQTGDEDHSTPGVDMKVHAKPVPCKAAQTRLQQPGRRQ